MPPPVSQESNSVTTRNASVHRDQTIRTATENRRPKPAPSEAASAEEEYVDLDESPSSRPTESLAGNTIEDSSSSSEDEEYVDMDESPSSAQKTPSVSSVSMISVKGNQYAPTLPLSKKSRSGVCERKYIESFATLK